METSSGVNKIQANLTDVYSVVIEIHSLIRARFPDPTEGIPRGVQANTSEAASLQYVPAPPRLYGRDIVVRAAAGKICDAQQRHIALLGTGGIGKTSVALGVVDDLGVKGQNDCYFVRCDTVISDLTLVASILQAMEKNSSDNGDPMKNLKTCLEAASRPIVLVLDNFESPWSLDTPNIQPRLTEVLRTLAAIPKLQLIVTMRGNAPPADGDVPWSVMHLDPLGHIPARELFLSIKPDTSPSEFKDLDLLLQKCDGLPLAIKLLALLKSSSTCGRLLKQWEKQKTSLLKTNHPSESRETSMRVSISMSLQSAPMRRHPDAIPLLAVICRLPDGILGGVEQLEEMDLGFDDVDEALATVLGSGLAFKAEN
ncbi:hypothetical protein PUNSTDRAFT_128644, partial [Punctularia strigosozonata HHB-11173 SS5]